MEDINVKILCTNIVNNPDHFTVEELEKYFRDHADDKVEEAKKLRGEIDPKLLQRIIDKWGTEMQINKIQEEALELALILNQRNCPTKDPLKMTDDLYGELGDMKIMMAQAEILFDADRINEMVVRKLNRVQEKYGI